jgi:hypothetical protein
MHARQGPQYRRPIFVWPLAASRGRLALKFTHFFGKLTPAATCQLDMA